MKYRIRYLLFVLLVSACNMAFTGCSSDSDESDMNFMKATPYRTLILGEWYVHVNPHNDKNYPATRAWFYVDGTYEFKDYHDDVTASKESNDSFESLTGKGKGYYYIEDKNITIYGNSQICGKYIIDGLVVNGFRFIRADYPNEYPYLIGGYHHR